MKIGFVIFDEMTSLDFVGFFDAITRLKTMQIDESISWEICGFQESVLDDRGLSYKVDVVQPNLSRYDLLFVPGGIGTRTLCHDEAFMAWFKTAADVPCKVSVCTGSLLYGAAGFLKGKCATTHPRAYDLLAEYGVDVVQQRIVRDGQMITGGGVAVSIDLGLYVCELLAGVDAVRILQTQMDYPYYGTLTGLPERA